MNDNIFTIFDTETTGFSPAKGDKIIEIAAIKVCNGKVLEGQTFETFVNPMRELSFEAAQVNKITQDMVENAPTIEEVIPKFLEFIQGTKLVAHNAEFDMSFLEHEVLIWNPFEQLPEAFCTKILSRKIFPNEKFHNLDSISYRLQIPKPENARHRALTDVLLLAEVFEKLLQEGKVTSLEDLRRLATS